MKKIPLSAITIGAAATALFVLAYNAGSLGRLVSTVLTTIAAIAVVGGIWLFSNMILTQARSRWPVYLGISWGLIAAALFGIMRGTRVITALFVEPDQTILGGGGSGFFGHVEWPLFGAALWGIGAAAIGTLDRRSWRLPIGIAMGGVTGWLIASHTLLWQRPVLNWPAAIFWVVVGIAIALLVLYRAPVLRATGLMQPSALETRRIDPVPAVLVGAALGWIFAVWLRADFATTRTGPPRLAAIVPLALIGARIAWKNRPTSSQIAILEERGRAMIFLGPAMIFLTAALVVPAIGTVRLSFLNRTSERSVGFKNYNDLFGDKESFDVSNWQNLFGSQLFWIAVVLIGAGALIGVFIGRTRNGTTSFERTGSSIGSIAVGVFVLLMGVFSVLRGTFFNNLWWIVTVTVISVVLGLTIAVLAEQAGRFESVAKSFIFMPMAVSFVGASIVWRLQYQARPFPREQTGLLNYIWIKLGRLSHSGWPRMIALLLLALIIVRIGTSIYKRAVVRDSFGGLVAALLVVGHIFIELLRRSLGGFILDANGDWTREQFVLFLDRSQTEGIGAFNNVALMVILIWIQTGFAMVILSAAIKAVPSEYIEAARVDGATKSQVFFNITLPSILPTIGVITTTLIVLVAKVFDIVLVTTGGIAGTNVLANDFFKELTENKGLSAAIATLILISVLPVMVLNIRRMQTARAS